MKTPSVTIRDVRGGRCADGAVLAELAESWADDEHSRECGPAAGAVDYGGAGEVGEAHLGEPAASPGPCADDGVDDGGEDEGEEEERPHLDAFGEGAGYDGCGGGDEDHLEEPVGHDGVVALPFCRLLQDPGGGGCDLGVTGVEECDLGG